MTGPRVGRSPAGVAGAWAICLLLAGTTACLAPQVAPPPSPADSTEAREALARVTTAYWEEVIPRRPRMAAADGQRVDALPSPALDLATADRTQFVARRLGRALERIEVEALSPRDYASLQTLRWELDMEAEAATFRAIDFSLLSPRESPLRDAIALLLEHPFATASDLDRYLFLVDGLALWATDARGALQERAEQKQVASRDAVDAFSAWLQRFRTLVADGELAVAPPRLVRMDSLLIEAFRMQEREGLQQRLVPALDSLVSFLGGYREQAMPRPGLWQYPGGKEYYRHLLRRRLAVEVEPEEAHQAGLSRLRRIDSLLTIVARRLQSTGPLRLDSLRALPRFAARSPDTVAAAIRDLVGALRDSVQARATRDSSTAPFVGLPDSLPQVRVSTPLEALLDPDGRVRPPEYVESRPELVVTPWWGSTTAQLEGPGRVYNWGWPGRSLATAMAQTSGGLNPVIALHPSGATEDGWGAYAAALAGEQGFLADPLASWGQLMREGLDAAWLVVDTGIHWFGWSRPQALAVLRPFSTATTAELDSLFVAKVVTAPGSAGAAAIGARELAAMRTWMQRLLGPEFRAADWHRELLGIGPAPLPVLAAHFEWWGYEQRRAAAGRDKRP